MNIIKIYCFFLIMILLGACTESSVDEDVGDDVQFSYDAKFFLTPNLGGIRESIDVNIKNGVGVRLSPGGRYSLYAKIDSIDVEPLLFIDGAKCCDCGCRGIHEGNHLQFDFFCNVDKPTLVTLSLKSENEEILETSFHHVRLDGEGVYSDHLSLNLIVVGALGGFSDGETIDTLAKNIGQFVQEIFEVKVDTVYVSFANEHPKVGYLYPKDSALFIQSHEDVFDLSEPWNVPEKDNAFDIVLVKDFFNGSTTGQSRPFFMPVSFGVSLVVVSFRNIKNVQKTVAHELGHVLGLEHTTLTKNDLLRSGDYSLLDDGLDDTPNCQYIMDNLLMKQGRILFYSFRNQEGIRNETNFDTLNDDYDAKYCLANIMFPYGNMGGRESSPMQRTIVKKNLTLIPH